MMYMRITSTFADLTKDGEESPTNDYGPSYSDNGGGWDSVAQLQRKKQLQARQNPNIKSVTNIEKGVRIQHVNAAYRLQLIQYIELVEGRN